MIFGFFKKITLIKAFLLAIGVPFGLTCQASFDPIAIGNYGTIIDRQQDKTATIEKIQLFSQEKDNSSKTIERSAILLRYNDAIATILMCHGFMCDKYDQGFLRHIFPKGKYNIMTFDFRAHGEKTEGQMCTFGKDEAYDVQAAAKFLKNHPDLKNKPLFVYGFSMGAVSAIEAQAKEPLFQAMVLDCPFDSSENVLKRTLDNVKFSIFGYQFNIPGRHILHKYAFHPYVQNFLKMVLRAVAKLDPRNINIQLQPLYPIKSVEKVSVPIFFILCKKDEKVSIDAMKTMFNVSGSSYKQLWITNGRCHFDSFFYSPEKYTERVREFLDLAIAGSMTSVKKEEIIEDKDDGVFYDRKGI